MVVNTCDVTCSSWISPCGHSEAVSLLNVGFITLSLSLSGGISCFEGLVGVFSSDYCCFFMWCLKWIGACLLFTSWSKRTASLQSASPHTSPACQRWNEMRNVWVFSTSFMWVMGVWFGSVCWRIFCLLIGISEEALTHSQHSTDLLQFAHIWL